jgi:anti-anti-sigma factor
MYAGVADTLTRTDATQPEEVVTLKVQFTLEDQMCTLRLAGSLACSSIHTLEAQIDELGCATFAAVVLDLSQLAYLDDVGANVLLGFHHYVAARGAEMMVCGADADISSMLNQLELTTDPSVPSRLH